MMREISRDDVITLLLLVPFISGVLIILFFTFVMLNVLGVSCGFGLVSGRMVIAVAEFIKGVNVSKLDNNKD
ncbi:hypothetical protein COU61_05000 [Candidatus Pacearchaeota archaeon CG10_big_fil_rev_8_21_14_0_10_35_13]|nr:MAG: hypothetical protein COU61_05000 [Candidatus Pacearchaeota archaeon CG10_big_fil_rev_8_21_14_0_10_35_13]